MFSFKRVTAALGLTTAVALTGFAGMASAQQDLRNADQRVPPPSGPADRIHQPADRIQQDLRNPDQRVAPAPVLPTRGQDLRNADRRAPAVMAPAETTGVSLSPETVDGAPVIRVPVHGFDWGDAGIGAVAGLAIVMLTGAVALLFTQRRRHARVAA